MTDDWFTTENSTIVVQSTSVDVPPHFSIIPGDIDVKQFAKKHNLRIVSINEERTKMVPRKNLRHLWRKLKRWWADKFDDGWERVDDDDDWDWEEEDDDDGWDEQEHDPSYLTTLKAIMAERRRDQE